MISHKRLAEIKHHFETSDHVGTCTFDVLDLFAYIGELRTKLAVLHRRAQKAEGALTR